MDRVQQEGGRLQVVGKQVVEQSPTDWFRTDARVECNRAYIGGWEVTDAEGTVHTPATARWFGGEITVQDAPWVWARKGDAQRVIAALELLASILAIMLFDPDNRRSTVCACSITGSTDNKGNSYIVKKMLSTKFSITPLLIELSEQLRMRKAELHLKWIPREDNQEADDLSNLNFKDFSAARRIQFSIGETQWKVFNELITVTKQMFDAISIERERQVNTKRKVHPIKRLRGSKRLRWTDPW